MKKIVVLVIVVGCALKLASCSPTQIPVAAPVAPVNISCNVNLTAMDGGAISFELGSTEGQDAVGARWLDHYCGSDPSQSTGQEVTSRVDPTTNLSATVAATGQGTANAVPAPAPPDAGVSPDAGASR